MTNIYLKKLGGYVEDIEKDGKKTKKICLIFSLILVASNIFIITINQFQYSILGISIGFWILTFLIHKNHRIWQTRINNYWDKKS